MSGEEKRLYLEQISTEDLLEEIRSRSRNFAMAVELPSTDDVRFFSTYSIEPVYQSLGMARALVIDIEESLRSSTKEVSDE